MLTAIIKFLSGKLFGPTDFNSVTLDLWDVRHKFDVLGTELGLLQSDISAIQMTKMGNVDGCFQEVITRCIAKGLYQGDIIKALFSRKVNEDRLAQELRTKYKVYMWSIGRVWL